MGLLGTVGTQAQSRGCHHMPVAYCEFGLLAGRQGSVVAGGQQASRKV